MLLLAVACVAALLVQVFETRVNGAHVHPPSSLSRFIVRDRGNASPRLLRSTLNAVPVSTDMLNNSGMQFALSVQPLAQPDPEDDPVVVSRSGHADGLAEWVQLQLASTSVCCMTGSLQYRLVSNQYLHTAGRPQETRQLPTLLANQQLRQTCPGVCTCSWASDIWHSAERPFHSRFSAILTQISRVCLTNFMLPFGLGLQVCTSNSTPWVHRVALTQQWCTTNSVDLPLSHTGCGPG